MTNNKTWKEVLIVNRGGKIAMNLYSVINSRIMNQQTMVHEYQPGYMLNNMLQLATNFVNLAVAKDFNIRMYVPDDVAIKARIYFSRLSKKSEKEIMSAAESLRPLTTEYTTDDIADDYVAQLQNFYKALKNAGDKIIVSVNKRHELTNKALIVPEDVIVQNGQELVFKNGKTEDGITVRDWANFNGKVVAKVRTVGSFSDVFFSAPNTAEQRNKRDMETQLWKLVPPAEFKLGEVVSTEEMFGASVA